MNTLKPLLIVAVLAGVGYGVYVRLNRGANAPPPPVAAGWDSTPAIELPGESGGAPSTGPAPPSYTPPHAAPPVATADGAAPAYQPPTALPPAAVAPNDAPYGQADGGGVAAPYASQPGGDVATPIPPQAGPGEAPAASPYDPAPVAATPNPGAAPPADPYADPNAPAPYPAPETAGAPAAEPAPTEQAAPGTPPAASPYGAEVAPSPGEQPAPAAGGSAEFATALDTAKRELEGGQMAAALRQLSTWYGKPGLAPQEQQQLNQLLDQVAGTVVYSTQHLLEPPYEVQPGERLEDIGEKYRVPWELLAKINGVDDPTALRPGEQLKVLRGPFQAVVSLENRELTLLTGDGSYAGRFKIGVGSEHPPQEGTFAVSEKVVNPVYYGRERAVSAEDPANPLGERWIGLGKNMGIHGTNNPESVGRNDLPGSITLSERDVEDVYDILSLGSRVTIRR